MSFEIKDKRLDKLITKNDRQELERLGNRGELLNGLMQIEENVLLITNFSFCLTLFYTLYMQGVYWVTGVVNGLICFIHPWVLWAIRFMNINVNFKITDSLLVASGIYLGIWFIGGILSHLIGMTNDDIDEILFKYDEEDNGDGY